MAPVFRHGRLIGLLLATTVLALAQTSTLVPLTSGGSQVAISDDGKVVYFTSGLRLKGAPPDNPRSLTEYRIYRAGPDGVSVFVERGDLASPTTFSGGSGAMAPKLSSDGSVVGVTLNDVCFDVACKTSTSVGELRGSRSTRIGQGTLQLSRNGRWALLLSPTSSGSSGGVVLPPFVPTLVDLQTGDRIAIPASSIGVLRAVASDGSVFVASPQLGVWKQGVTSPLALQSGFSIGRFALSDDGRTVFASRVLTGVPTAERRPQLVAIDVATGTTTVVYESEWQYLPVFLAASSNGLRVLFNVQSSNVGPAFVADRSTGVSAPIPLPDGDVVVDGALTASGDIAALATTSGSLFKVRVGTGPTEALLPPTPMCTPPLNGSAPGSLIRLQCHGMDPTLDLTGRILISGRAAPLLSADTGGNVAVQVPWETTTGNADLELVASSASPFDPKGRISIGPIAPNFERFAGDQPHLLSIALFKADWSGPVDAPPGPGEIMHLYMTGLGAVKTPIPTGTPASLTETNPTLASVACRLLPANTPLTTLFSGLAPGTLGIYQVSLQTPAEMPAVAVRGLSCSVMSSGGSGSTSVILVP